MPVAPVNYQVAIVRFLQTSGNKIGWIGLIHGIHKMAKLKLRQAATIVAPSKPHCQLASWPCGDRPVQSPSYTLLNGIFPSRLEKVQL